MRDTVEDGGAHQLRVIDNDRDEISIWRDGKEIRGWSYRNETERRAKMLAAREFAEGWFQAEKLDPAKHELRAALADARLIAAAPETAAERDALLAVNAVMLEALKALFNADLGSHEKAKAAIAKAEGKS